MTRPACQHGSASRLQWHLHWCPSCASWRHYSFASFWLPGRPGALARWSDQQLLGMGDLSVEQTDPEELLALVRQLLIRTQATELDAREQGRWGGQRALLERLLASPRRPESD